MKLHRLYIGEFKNLRDVDVRFDGASPFTVVVGRNGTGKSNILEALVLIFRHLDLKEPAPFRYMVEYECRSTAISIDASGDRVAAAAGPTFADLEPLSRAQFEEVTATGQRRYLPAHVFGYYSGPSNRLERHFEKHHVKFYRDLLAGEASAHLRSLFYARNVHSQFVLLAFFSGLGENQAAFLKTHLGIHGLDSVLFVLNEPAWANGAKFADFGWFWGARGIVRDFLDVAHQVALAPLTISDVRVPLGLARSEKRDHVYLYLPTAKHLQRVAAPYADKGGQEAFFAALESTYISDLIRETRVVVRVGREEDRLSFRELSEGEQQLLMVLGLLKFTQREESLFLLDEPDTHLNPAWSVEYIDLLGQVVGDSGKSHFVITTHNPLIIAGRVKEEVLLLERDDNGGVRAAHPTDDPRGKGVAALLTSEVYGLRSQLDLATLEELEEKRRLHLRRDEFTETEAARYAHLTEKLGRIDLTTVVRDPLYPQFVDAMTAHAMKADRPTVSPEERAEKAELAVKIIDDLKGASE